MGGLLRAAAFLDRIARGIGQLASWLILPLIAVIMFDVITRKVHFINQWSAEFTMEHGFSISFILQDLEWHLHGALLLMTFGFGYLANAHVRVDIFRERLRPRAQVWLEAIGLALGGIPFVLVMLWFAWVMTQASWLQGEGSESQVGIGMRYIIKSFLVWGFLVLLMAALATLIRCAAWLFGTPRDRAEADAGIQFFSAAEPPPPAPDEPAPGIEGTRT